MTVQEPRGGSRNTRLLEVVLVPLLIALLGTLAVAAVSWRWYADQRDTGVEEQALRVDRIARSVDLRLRTLRGLAEANAQRWAPGAAAPGDQEQWSAELAAAQGVEPSLIAILYLERIRAADIPEVEQRFREETGSSLGLEPGADALALTRGAPSAVLGLDLTGNPLVIPSIERSGSDLVVSTIDPADFGLTGSETAGPVVVLSVPDRAPGGVLRGHALAVFAGGGLARGVQDNGQSADGIDIVALLEPRLLLGSVPALGTQLADPVTRSVRALEPEVPAATTVTPLTAMGAGRGPLALAGAGALLSVLLGALLFTVSRSRDRAEAAVVRATEELKESELRLQALVRHAADVIAVVGADGRITYVSPSVEAQYGYRADELVGVDILGIDNTELTRRTLRELGDLDDGETKTREAVFHRRDGSHVHVRVTVTNLLADASVRGYVANVHDISDHKAYESLLAQQAREDPLTGLPNRAQLEEVMTAAHSASTEFAVLFVDLDGFKSVNDDLGHDAGDDVLRQLAGRLRSAVRPTDSLVRLGGDEFVVVAESCGEPAAREIAARIQHTLRDPFVVDGRTAVVGASVGIAVGGPETTDLAGLLREADLDMYRSKLAGRS